MTTCSNSDVSDNRELLATTMPALCLICQHCYCHALSLLLQCSNRVHTGVTELTESFAMQCFDVCGCKIKHYYDTVLLYCICH